MLFYGNQIRLISISAHLTPAIWQNQSSVLTPGTAKIQRHAWGEVDADTIEILLKERGRMVGDKPVDDAAIKESSKYKTVAAFSKAMAAGEATMKDVEGLKPIFRLHPPRGSKGWGGIKRSYTVGGALGFRGEAISELAGRML